MSDSDINEPTGGWWSKQSGKSKAVLGLAGFCCLGLLILVVAGGFMSPDASTTNSTSSDDSSSSSTTSPQPVESESDYKASCKKISFKELNKNPESHAGERVKLSGRVIQIMESGGLTDIRMDVNDNFGDTVYVTYAGTTSALEDSMITIYGEVVGSYTYESQAGWEITLPEIDAKYVTVSK